MSSCGAPERRTAAQYQTHLGRRDLQLVRCSTFVPFATGDSRNSRFGAPEGRYRWYDFLDCFRLNLELLEPWQAPAQDIVLLERSCPVVSWARRSSNIRACAHGKGNRYEQAW